MKKKQSKLGVRSAKPSKDDACHPQMSLVLPSRASAAVLPFPRKESTTRLSQQEALKRILDLASSFRRG